MPFSKHVPRPLSSSAIHAFAPTTSGVYGISNAREWLLIEETDNIQGALLGHIKDPDGALMRLNPTGFVFEACDQASRPARKARLILEYKPSHNGDVPHSTSSSRTRQAYR